MEFIIKVIKGMIIGVASLTAGAGTFAIVLGIYDRCMEIIAKPFKNFKENVIYIFPIILGIVISVLIFKNGIVFLLENYSSYVKFAFLGIILGGIPALLKVANKNGYNKKYLISLVLAFFATLICTYIGDKFGQSSGAESKMGTMYLVIYGIIYGFGAIMPGMTTIHVLIFIGVLAPIMEGIFNIDLNIIIPFGVGYLAIVVLTANIISYLFKRFYGYTYYAIIGFSVTSLIMLIPQVTTVTEYILCPIIAIITGGTMYWVSKMENNIKAKEEELLRMSK